MPKKAGFTQAQIDRFIEAARDGDLKRVQSFLDKGIDVNAVHSNSFFDRNTALIFALEKSRHAVIKTLITAGADPHKASKHNVVPAQFAKDPESMQLLASAGVDVAQLRPTKTFQSAALVEYLVRAGANVNAMGVHGRTPLMDVLIESYSKEECLHLLNLLLERGANIRDSDHDGYSVLHLAARHRDPELWRLLVDKGADLHAKDRLGRDFWAKVREIMLWEAKQFQPLKSQAIRLGLYDPNIDALVEACALGKLALVKKLVANGADVNAPGDKVSPKQTKYMLTGVLPLDIAAQMDRRSVFQFLVNHGADPNRSTCRRKREHPMLEAFAIDGNPEIVSLLLTVGADVRKVSVFQLFVRYGRGRWTKKHNECIRLLIAAGLDVTVVEDIDGMQESVSQAAERVRNKELTQILKEAGAS